ncbi:MAG: helix-turn-helix domain-containing protein [Acidimicrobiales bacterium]
MATASTLPQLLTIDQLAERLGVTVRHIRRLVAERRVPFLKVGRLIRFDPAEIALWLDEARHAQRQVSDRTRPVTPGAARH